MMKCWASSLGNCSGPLSAEHVVSKSWYGVKSVTVSGMPWCRTAPKTVGVANLTAKILCRHHNTELSPIDAAAKHTCNVLDRCIQFSSQRIKQNPLTWSPECFTIDGPLFERWLAKTTVNLMVAREFNIADGAMFLAPVPEELICFIFGLKPLPSPRGLYIAFQPDELIGSNNTMSIDVIADPVVGLLGVLFYIQGFRFMLWLGAHDPPNPLELPGAMEPAWQRSHIHRHLGQLQWIVQEKISHYLNFNWPEQARSTLKLYC